nr:LysR family transcriptional regulator [Endozoicomonas sp. OPT23]
MRRIEIFCRVVELGSFTKVADETSLSRTIIGRYIASLEEELGIRLISRTTRKMSVTEAGRDYYDGCKSILGQMGELEQSVQHRDMEPRGVLKVAMSAGFGCLFMSELIEQFQNEYPAVKFDLHLTDHTEELVRERFDVIVEMVLEDSSSLNTDRRLALTELGLYASPLYLERFGTPEKPEDLKQHRLNHFSPAVWPHNVQLQGLGLDWHLASNEGYMLLLSMLKGNSMGFFPDILVSNLVQTGELVKVLADMPSTKLELRVDYGPGKRSRKISLFLDRLHSSFADPVFIKNFSQQDQCSFN